MAKLSSHSNTENTVRIISEAFDFLAENGWEGHFELITPAGGHIKYQARVRIVVPIVAKTPKKPTPNPKKAKHRT